MSDPVTVSVELPAVPVPVRDVTDPALWCFTGALALVAGLAAWRLGWGVNWDPLVNASAVVALFVGGGSFYQRREAAIARLLYAMGLTIALAYTGQVATYVVGTVGAPFNDLTRADAWFGFSWPAWSAWVIERPALHATLAFVYPLHFAASGVAITVLALRTERGAVRFLRAFVVAFLVAVLGQLFVPALSEIHNAPSNPVRIALRSGTFHTVDLTQGVGLISFPSMHAALAVMVCAGLWQYHRWRVPLAVFTAVMLLSIPSEGGHYLVDVLAGSVLGGLAWRLADWQMRPSRRSQIS